MVKIVIVFDSIIVVFVIVRGVVAVVVSVRLMVFSVSFVKADVVIGFEFACLYDMYLSVGVSLGVVFAAIVDPVIFKVVGVFLFVRVVVFSVNFVRANVVIGFSFDCLYDMYDFVFVIVAVVVGIVLGVVFAAIVDPVIFKVVGVFLFVKVVVFSVHVVGVRIGSVCSYVLYSVDLVVLI